MCALSVVTSDHQRLYDELERLRRRSIPLAFGNHEGNGPIKIDIFNRIVNALHPRASDSELSQIEAATETISAAIRQLPAERLPKTDRRSEMTYQQAASLIFQVPPLSLELLSRIEHQYEVPKHSYAKIARYVQEVAGIPDTEKAIQQVNNRIRSELASILLREEERMTAHAHESSTGEETADQTSAAVDSPAPQSNTFQDAANPARPEDSMAGMNVTITNSENIVVGPNASQTNHIHK